MRTRTQTRFSVPHAVGIVHVIMILSAAVGVRLLFYEHIAIRGDLGYWMLDGQWVADGDRPFIDFIGRSPLFLYLYAAVIEVFGESIAVFRWFVASLWICAALVLAGVTRMVATHRASLLTLAAATLTPFPVAFAFFSSSQSLGVLLVAMALAALVATDEWWLYYTAGSLVGLAFLSRRAFVLAGPAIASWALIRYHRDLLTLPAATLRSLATGAGFLATISSAYILLTLPDSAAAVDLFIIHFVNLFISAGSGGVPLLSMAETVSSGETATSSTALPFQAIFDRRSMQAVLATILAGAPLLIGLLDHAHTACDEWLRPLDETMAYSMAGLLAPFAAASAALAGLWYRVAWLVAIAVLLWAVQARDRLPTARLLSPAVALPTLLFAWVQVGYFIRPNLYATYYGMDSLLFLAVPLGIMADKWLDTLSRHRVAVAAIACAVLVVVGGVPMAPFLPGLSTTVDGQHDRVPFYTADKVQRVNEDLEDRAGSGATVLTSQPNYVATNNVSVFEQNTRAVYLRHLFEDSGPQREYYGRLIDAMRAGEVSYIVHDEFNQIMLSTNSTANATMHQCYEPVDADGLYRSLNTTLYQYNGCRA